MEKEKKGIRCSYGVLIIILFATVCFLTDYIVIDRKLQEDKITIFDDEIIDKNDASVVDNSIVDTTEIESEENRYATFAQNMISERQTYFNDYSKYRYHVDGLSGYPFKYYSVELSKEGELTVTYYNDGEEPDKRVIANNVLSFFVYEYGNGGLKGLNFIYEDGTVGGANIEYAKIHGEEIRVTKSTEYKNIVSILSANSSDGMSGAMRVVYVDIDGHIY